MSGKNTSRSFFYTLLGYLAILVILLVIALTIGAGLYWFVILPGRMLVSGLVCKVGGTRHKYTGDFLVGD